MEVHVVLDLEPGRVIGTLALQPDLDGEVEQDRQIRREPVGGRIVQLPQGVERHPGTEALVREGRVGEASAHDGCSVGECRPDHMPDELPPSRFEQQRVGERIGLLDATVAGEEDLAQLLAEPCPAGFPRDDDIDTCGPQPLGQRLDLGRLA